jgi:hypothetical protein
MSRPGTHKLCVQAALCITSLLRRGKGFQQLRKTNIKEEWERTPSMLLILHVQMCFENHEKKRSPMKKKKKKWCIHAVVTHAPKRTPIEDFSSSLIIMNNREMGGSRVSWKWSVLSLLRVAYPAFDVQVQTHDQCCARSGSLLLATSKAIQSARWAKKRLVWQAVATMLSDAGKTSREYCRMLLAEVSECENFLEWRHTESSFASLRLRWRATNSPREKLIPK